MCVCVCACRKGDRERGEGEEEGTGRKVGMVERGGSIFKVADTELISAPSSGFITQSVRVL